MKKSNNKIVNYLLIRGGLVILNKIINKRIKNKVLNYSKYQIDSIQNITNFIGIKIYKIIFKNNKSKVIITFNNL